MLGVGCVIAVDVESGCVVHFGHAPYGLIALNLVQ